jgi:hypothetical protein
MEDQDHHLTCTAPEAGAAEAEQLAQRAAAETEVFTVVEGVAAAAEPHRRAAEAVEVQGMPL